MKGAARTKNSSSVHVPQLQETQWNAISHSSDHSVNQGTQQTHLEDTCQQVHGENTEQQIHEQNLHQTTHAQSTVRQMQEIQQQTDRKDRKDTIHQTDRQNTPQRKRLNTRPQNKQLLPIPVSIQQALLVQGPDPTFNADQVQTSQTEAANKQKIGYDSGTSDDKKTLMRLAGVTHRNLYTGSGKEHVGECYTSTDVTYIYMLCLCFYS